MKPNKEDLIFHDACRDPIKHRALVSKLLKQRRNILIIGIIVSALSLTESIFKIINLHNGPLGDSSSMFSYFIVFVLYHNTDVKIKVLLTVK